MFILYLTSQDSRGERIDMDEEGAKIKNEEVKRAFMEDGEGEGQLRPNTYLGMIMV